MTCSRECRPDSVSVLFDSVLCYDLTAELFRERSLGLGFMHIFPLTFVLLSLLLLSACTTHSYKSRKQTAETAALEANFQQFNFDTVLFQIYGWKKITQPLNKTLVIYIEGDGQAWKTRFKISKNPTPRKPMSLYLAIQDSSVNIIYLARPCQFINLEKSSHCQSKYWGSHRYSQEVIDSYHSVLNQIRHTYNIKKFELVGYSGGGIIAALLAGQRNDITKLITIASNLDHLAWTQYHNISPLSGSLNLYSNQLDFSKINQLHLWGAKDSIVPYEINKNLLDKKLNNELSSYIIYKQFDHSCCWVENWNKYR